MFIVDRIITVDGGGGVKWITIVIEVRAEFTSLLFLWIFPGTQQRTRFFRSSYRRLVSSYCLLHRLTPENQMSTL